MSVILARLRSPGRGTCHCCGERGVLTIVKVRDMPRSRVCLSRCLPSFLRDTLGRAPMIDDSASRRLGADILLDAILLRIKGRKLRRVIRLLRHVGFERGELAAKLLGIQQRSVEQAVRRFVAQAKAFSDDPKLRAMFERFLLP